MPYIKSAIISGRQENGPHHERTVASDQYRTNKKGNPLQRKYYCTISVIYHPTKVMQKVLLNRLKFRQKQSAWKNWQALEQDVVQQNRFSASGYCVRGTSNINKTAFRYGTKTFGLLQSFTTLTPA